MLEDIIKENKKKIDNNIGEICKLEEALKIEKERTKAKEIFFETGQTAIEEKEKLLNIREEKN